MVALNTPYQHTLSMTDDKGNSITYPVSGYTIDYKDGSVEVTVDPPVICWSIDAERDGGYEYQALYCASHQSLWCKDVLDFIGERKDKQLCTDALEHCAEKKMSLNLAVQVFKDHEMLVRVAIATAIPTRAGAYKMYVHTLDPYDPSSTRVEFIGFFNKNDSIQSIRGRIMDWLQDKSYDKDMKSPCRSALHGYIEEVHWSKVMDLGVQPDGLIGPDIRAQLLSVLLYGECISCKNKKVEYSSLIPDLGTQPTWKKS